MRYTKIIKRLVLLGLASALVMNGIWASPAVDPTTASKASVAFLTGKVQIDGKIAKIGQVVLPTSKIVTGPASECVVVFDSRNAIRFGQNTTATLDLTGAVKQLALAQGEVSSVLRNLAKVVNQDRFKITSRTAVAAVRGTSFFVKADSNWTYICECNGTVITEGIDQKGREIHTNIHHDNAFRYELVNGKTTIKRDAMLYHTDKDMESLAGLINEKIDWTTPDSY